MLLPEDRSESLEIPAFCVEIVGSKAIWSTDSTTQSMFIGMFESLSYMPMSYGLEIKHEIMKIYTMKRNLKYNRVDVESKEFSLAGSLQKMRETLHCLIDDLSEIFLTIALELTTCAFAVAKYLQHAGYTDPKLLNHGRCVLLHKDCLHLHASSFKRYILDIESKREEYEGFRGNGDDDDDDNQGNGDRQKSLHQIGCVPHKETDVAGQGGAATSKNLGARGRRQSAGHKAANVATGSKQSAVATGDKQSTGRTGTQHNRCSSRTKKCHNLKNTESKNLKITKYNCIFGNSHISIYVVTRTTSFW